VKDISVVIVNLNTEEFIGRCLSSLFCELDGLANEVFVVDNGSMDSSVEFIEREFPECRLIENNENRGFGRANNQAITLAAAPYVLLVNPDTELLPGCVSSLLTYMNEHPEVAAVGPRTLYPDGRVQPSVFSFPTLLTEFLAATFLYLIVRRIPGLRDRWAFSWSPVSEREVDWMRGACILFRADVLRELGGFDEQYFMYTEELDLQYRMARKGWKRMFYPRAEIVHHHGLTVNREQRTRSGDSSSCTISPERCFVELHTSKLQFMGTFHPPWYVFLMKTLWTLNNALRWSVFTPVALVSRSETLTLKVRKHKAALRYLLRRRHSE